MSDHSAHADNGHAEHKHGIAHVMPMPILFGVFFALIGLTAVTVISHEFDLGALNIWVAMGIATVKALLVAVFFMHLRYDKPLNAIVIGSSFVFAMLFICIALMDSHNYQGNIDQFRNKEHPPASSQTTDVPQGPGVIKVAPTAPAK